MTPRVEIYFLPTGVRQVFWILTPPLRKYGLSTGPTRAPPGRGRSRRLATTLTGPPARALGPGTLPGLFLTIRRRYRLQDTLTPTPLGPLLARLALSRDSTRAAGAPYHCVGPRTTPSAFTPDRVKEDVSDLTSSQTRRSGHLCEFCPGGKGMASRRQVGWPGGSDARG